MDKGVKFGNNSADFEPSIGNMGWTMDMGTVEPGYIHRMTPEQILFNLKDALCNASGRIDHLAHMHGADPISSHPELEFIGNALLRLCRGQAVDKNPFEREISSEKI